MVFTATNRNVFIFLKVFHLLMWTFMELLFLHLHFSITVNCLRSLVVESHQEVKNAGNDSVSMVSQKFSIFITPCIYKVVHCFGIVLPGQLVLLFEEI